MRLSLYPLAVALVAEAEAEAALPQKADPCLTNTDINNISCYVTPAGYTPLTFETLPSGFTVWEGTEGVAEAKRTSQYKGSGGTNRIGPSPADQISAAYAHARGWTGAGIIISVMGEPIYTNADEINGKIYAGYKATDRSEVFGSGLCSGTDCVNNNYKDGTHLTAIIVGSATNGGRHAGHCLS